MKCKLNCLFAAVAFGLITIISWSLWTAGATAQTAPNATARQVTQTPVGSDSAPAWNTAEEPTSPLQSPAGQPLVAPIGPPIGLSTYPALPAPTGYQSSAAPIDAKTMELVKAYRQQQSEINQLLKKYSEAAESDKNVLRDQIVKATTIQFDLRQQVREREIEQLKARLADVESAVQQRNELKDKIVEKRVADILREPNRLEWEPLGNNPTTIFAPAAVRPTTVLPGPMASESKRVPRAVVRYHLETIVDAAGNKKQVWKPVTEIEYVQTDEDGRNVPGAGAFTPAETPSPRSMTQPQPSRQNPFSAQDPFGPSVPTGSDYQPSSMNTTLAEAEARVRIAQRKHDLMLQSYEAAVVSQQELQAAEAELELAKLGQTRARIEFEGHRKLLELDVRQAEASYAKAQAELAEAINVNKRAPNAISEPQMAAHRAMVEQAQIALERTKTMLELHENANQSESKTDETSPPRER